MELVSICVPVFNGGKYLAECLDSILNQTYQCWECIINDNCSVDNTKSIAAKYVSLDPRFKYYSNKKFTTAIDNWNICLSRVSDNAVFYKCQPADDWIYPTYLQEMVKYMNGCEKAVIFSSYRLDSLFVNCDGLDIYSGNYFNGKEILIKELKGELNIFGSLNTVSYKIIYLKKLYNYPNIYNRNNIHSDTELVYAMLLMGDLAFSFQVLSFTRRHEETGSDFAIRYTTYLNNQHYMLWKYKTIDKSLEFKFKENKTLYAYFIFKNILYMNHSIIKWHYSRLYSKLTFFDYLVGIFCFNPIIRKLNIYLNKILSLTKKKKIVRTISGWNI